MLHVLTTPQSSTGSQSNMTVSLRTVRWTEGLIHTCLRRALVDLIGERSDAFVGNGSQREGVFGVGTQTLHHI